ncbi:MULTISPECIES: copper resistance CopC family protein [Microbacterium]|uniref:copper resistance CopC family protein n=1 Tax=Microbacterium TaxID=33882 RepID=UPI00217D95AC|nr:MULTISPECIES: copper resistance CopC family protein [Microbacterium]UWF77454.1 copper resistance protein CopC [Microbacterium neungamense]WCM55617.1 copper resistance protein CopC [Microbacterium sp. EF45047]
MSRIRTLLAGLAVATVAVLAVAGPASAHDELVSSDPADGQQLTAAPEQLVLTYSNSLLALEGENSGTAVVVTDEAGREWADGAPVVQAETVTVPLRQGMADGAYRVAWQVVSSDGHPISGEFGFTVASATPETAAPAETTEPAETAAPDESAEPEEAPAADAVPAALLWGLGALVLVAAAVTAVLRLRRRRS